MQITVAICTWNRCDLLAKTLDAMRSLQDPGNCDWQVLVVDNNSTDKTAEVVEGFKEKLPIRYIMERKQGLSNARNAAIEHSDCDYIVWTDDDVIVDPAWLRNYREAFHRWPNGVVFGGKVLPWYEVTPPLWVKDNMQTLASSFALRDLGDEERALAGNEYPFGANMAFRRDAFDDLRFDPDLGRKEKNLIGGEEVQVINSLRSNGADVVWVPACSVEHYLPKSRMTLRWVRAYFAGQGYTSDQAQRAGAKTLFGMERWRLRVFLFETARWMSQRLAGKASPIWLKTMLQASRTLGVLQRQRADAQLKPK
ncbi:MAG: glycosyltransferase [Pseudomonadota bacterium]